MTGCGDRPGARLPNGTVLALGAVWAGQWLRLQSGTQTGRRFVFLRRQEQCPGTFRRTRTGATERNVSAH